MDNSNETPVSPTRERLQAELRRLGWAKGLSEETFSALTNTAEWVEFRAADKVIEVDSEISHVSFLITGRMQATLYDMLGKEILKDTLARGSVIGLFALGLLDRSHMQVQATEPSTAIRWLPSVSLFLVSRAAAASIYTATCSVF